MPLSQCRGRGAEDRALSRPEPPPAEHRSGGLSRGSLADRLSLLLEARSAPARGQRGVGRCWLGRLGVEWGSHCSRDCGRVPVPPMPWRGTTSGPRGDPPARAGRAASLRAGKRVGAQSCAKFLSCKKKKERKKRGGGSSLRQDPLWDFGTPPPTGCFLGTLWRGEGSAASSRRLFSWDFLVVSHPSLAPGWEVRTRMVVGGVAQPF